MENYEWMPVWYTIIVYIVALIITLIAIPLAIIAGSVVLFFPIVTAIKI